MINELYEKHHISLQIYCAYLIGTGMQHPDVQDLVADTWHNIVKYSDTYQGRNNASWITWAKKIARNIWCKNLIYKRRRPESHVELTDILNIRGQKKDPSYDMQLQDLFEKMTLALNKKHLAVLYLRSQDFTGEEMSFILGVSINTVYSRLHYAKKYLIELWA